VVHECDVLARPGVPDRRVSLPVWLVALHVHNPMRGCM